MKRNFDVPQGAANPNDEASHGHRALQLAIKAGLNTTAQALIEHGAEVNTADRSGLTPFQIAVT